MVVQWLAPLLFKGAATAYNYFSDNANTLTENASGIGAAIDQGRAIVGKAGQGFGSKQNQLKQKFLNGVLDWGTSLVYRKIQQKARKNPKSAHLWRSARDAMLDPAMELLHRKAKIGIRDAIYDRNILTGAANDLADWDGSNFEFNPHKYNKYQDQSLTQEQLQATRHQNALQQRNRQAINQGNRNRYARIGTFIKERVPHIPRIQITQKEKMNEEKNLQRQDQPISTQVQNQAQTRTSQHIPPRTQEKKYTKKKTKKIRNNRKKTIQKKSGRILSPTLLKKRRRTKIINYVRRRK